MANQTVYPYGTGGSLPSSIGLINDLETGGVDKALTAEMGKTIKGYIDDIDEQVGQPAVYQAWSSRTPSYSLIDGYYISTDGVITASNTYSYSSPIQLFSGETINFSYYGGGQSAISLTDEHGTEYEMAVYGGDTPHKRNVVSYTATEDCYVSICGINNGVVVSLDTKVLYTSIYKIGINKSLDAEQVAVIKDETVSEPEFTITNGKFIGAYGLIETNPSYFYTSPIFLNEGDTLEFDFTGGAGVLTLAKVIAEDQYYEEIRKDTGTVGTPTHVTYTAPGTCMVAITGTSIVNVKVTHPSAVQIAVPITEYIKNIENTSRNDFKGEEYFEIPIPQKAKINVIASGLSQSKSTHIPCKIEYTDIEHNIFFKRDVTLTAQGQSSMDYIEKNQTLDFDDCEIKFGNWVAQDSFHLKAYYIDVFRGINNAMYNYVEDVIRMKDCRSNRVLRSGTTTYLTGAGNVFTDFGTDALCHPDGFPVELYLNGEYYGLYALNLKKHRDVYSMKKNNSGHILLDGQLGRATFWGGSINWTMFEIRNPKGLVCMDGSEYDGDNPKELIDSSSSSWDGTNSKHVFSATVKENIQALASAKGDIQALSTTEAKKAAFEQIFDVPMFLVYYVLSQTIDHYDGFHKNWIWTIYGGKAAPNFYDMDSVFGRYFKGEHVIHNPNYGSVENYSDTNSISHLFVSLYSNEIAALYGELREKGVISVDNIVGYIERWLERIGRAAFDRNLEAWPTIPSYRPTEQTNYTDGTQSALGMYDSVERVRVWLAGRIEYLDSLYSYSD